MDAVRRRQISQLLNSALELAPNERASFLQEACKGDDALRGEVERLLADRTSADAFFASVAAKSTANPRPGESRTAGASLQPGIRLGSYQIERQLGQGGMGAVFLAYDHTLRRKVAIKILDSPADDGGSRASLLREARSASTLNHPNICTIYQVNEESGHAFIAMEYVEGHPLSDLLTAGALPIEDVLRYAGEVADALAYAHERGVIHRDLKVANVMASSSGHLKIVDFGLARRADALTANATTATAPSGAGAVRGTPYAMAPEQVRGGTTDERTDVWALGVLLYEMLTTAKPFDALTRAELFSSILRDPPAPLPPRIPAPLREVVYKCLAKDPAGRYQSAADVRLALATIASALNTHLAPQEFPAPTPTPPSAGARRALVVSLIGACAILAAIAGVVAVRIIGRRGTIIRSIAVLPLVNLSKDSTQEFFVDGMTDGVINTLGRVSALKVIARTSVMPLKGSQKSVTAIASELGVDVVLEGSAMLAKDSAGTERLRVDISLIDPRTQTQIWSDTLERDLGSVLAVQGEIAQTIAEKIKVAITPDERRSLQASSPVDPEAYKLYLLGRQAWARRDATGLNLAVKLFGQSIDRDPRYAPAYAGIADSYALLAGDLGLIAWDVGAKQAVANATKALDLDPTLAEPHTSLAFTSFFLNWDWQAADEQFKEALQLNPSYATAHHWYGDYLSDIGHEEEALAEMRKALALDPLSAIISRDVAWPLFFSGRYEEAAQQLRQTLAEHDSFPPAERLLARTDAQMGNAGEAVRRFGLMLGRQDNVRDRCDLAWAYALAGQRADAERELTSALKDTTSRVYPYDAALVYAALGRVNDAFAQLQRAYGEHDPTMVNLRHDPRLNSLRSDLRYDALVARMRFPR